MPGLDKYHGTDTYLTEALTIEANKAVKQAVADEKPFYLYMAHYAIHAPFEPDPRFIDTYHQAGLKGMPATYASMIESMDKSLGDIRANLERLGVANDTIVIFMSDNGAPQPTPRNRPLRGYKITPYEGGIRVPMIVHWPGVTQRASICHDYVKIEDFFPTLIEMAGASLDDVAGPIDGVSFVPLLRGSGTFPKDRPLFWHYPNSYGYTPFSIIRQGDWKLIYHHADRRYELFNLAEHISEETNLAETHPAVRKRLAIRLADELKAMNAQMPIDRSTGKPVAWPGE